jgi:probable addiction module antidote protein
VTRAYLANETELTLTAINVANKLHNITLLSSSFESTYLKMATSKCYIEGLIERLSDPREAAAYLDAALEEGDRPAFLLAIRNVIDALGGMSQIARRTGLNRENLYRVLSKQGNPELNSLEKLLKALGLRLAVEVDQNMDHAA